MGKAKKKNGVMDVGKATLTLTGTIEFKALAKIFRRHRDRTIDTENAILEVLDIME